MNILSSYTITGVLLVRRLVPRPVNRYDKLIGCKCSFNDFNFAINLVKCPSRRARFSFNVYKRVEENIFEIIFYLRMVSKITLTGGGINCTIGVEFLRVAPIVVVTSSGFFFCFGLTNVRFTSCGYKRRNSQHKNEFAEINIVLPYKFVEL